jgi:hypothetical protein
MHTESGRNGSDGAAPPAFRKKPGQVPVSTRVTRLKAAAEQRRQARVHDLEPAELALVSEWADNGQNVAAAARTLGMAAATAARWMRRRRVQHFIRHVIPERNLGDLRDWGLLVPRAQQTLVALLDDEDGRVRLQAANSILDRGIGKVTQRLDHHVSQTATLDEVQMQAALSLVAEHGVPMTEAARYVLDHPDEVRQWAASVIDGAQVALRRAIPAEVVPGGG